MDALNVNCFKGLIFQGGGGSILGSLADSLCSCVNSTLEEFKAFNICICLGLLDT